MRRVHNLVLGCAMALAPIAAFATTYTVGPAGSGRQYTQLSAVFSSNNLAPGDIVEVDGNATYNGGVVVGNDDGGTEANPVIIRWKRVNGATRPRLQGGIHTIKFQQSNHMVFEGFDLTGGSNTCVFNEAHNITVRDSVIHDCPAHGILAADRLSGSFTLEYSEIYNTGASSNRHPMYIQSDEVAFPNAVFRMRFNYIHNGNGGNLVKVRHQRSEIYYNWLEGSAYQAIELIGPDCYEQQQGWNVNLKREDADVVGNVIIQSGSWSNAIRMGGDLNGRSQGRVRLVNNTILFTRAGAANAVMVQLGAESLEMHNNVVYQTTGGTPVMVKENIVGDTPEPCGPQSTAPWSSGRKVAGSNNWAQTSASVPSEWSGTIRGSNPGLANIGLSQLRPLAGSALLSQGINAPISPPVFTFPSPLIVPKYDPPQRAKMAIGAEHPRAWPSGRISIGALEQNEAGEQSQRIRVNGTQPRLPGSAAAGATAAPAPSRITQTSPVRPAAVRVHTPRVPRSTGTTVKWMKIHSWGPRKYLKRTSLD